MTTIEQTPASGPAAAGRLRGWDCVELWVGNARTTAGFLMSVFGFHCTAYAGPETGVREKASYVLEQGDIRFVVSGAARPPTRRSPSTCASTATACTTSPGWLTMQRAFEAAVARGARPVRARGPRWTRTGRWSSRRSGPTARRSTPSSAAPATRVRLLEPGYGTDNLPPTPVGPEVGLTRIDHVVGNVEKGKLDDWVRFYAEVLGFGQLVHFDDNQIATEYSALNVHRRVGRLQDRDADQRAGRRQEEEPDPGV